MGLFGSSANKQQQIAEMSRLAKEVTGEMYDLMTRLESTGIHVDSSVKTLAQSLGQKLNRIHEIKQRLGSAGNDVVFDNGFMPTSIRGFLFSMKTNASMIEQGTNVRFYLNF